MIRRSVATVVVTLGAVSCAHHPATSAVEKAVTIAPSSRLVQSQAKDAEASLEVVTKLDGVFAEEKRTFYFRRPKNGLDLGAMSITSSNVDGVSESEKGIGYGFSALVHPKQDALQIELSTYWSIEARKGKNEVSFQLPYFSDTAGTAGGYSYRCRWTMLR